MNQFASQRSACYDKCHMALSCLLGPYALCRQVLIRDGELGLTWWGDRPELLLPGRHCLLSPTNQFVLRARVHRTMFCCRNVRVSVSSSQ